MQPLQWVYTKYLELRISVDRRAFWIILITFVSLLLCAFFYIASLWCPLLRPLTNPGTFAGSFFISFAAGVANFAVLGAIITVVTLVRPETGSFESRCRILFRGRSGPHIDHLIQGLRKTLEHYAESTSAVLRIEGYDATHNLLRVTEETSFTLCSYVDDADTEYASAVELSESTEIPPGLAPNELIHVSCNDAPIVRPSSFTDSLNAPFAVQVRAHSPANVSYSFRIWMKNREEEGSFEPKRFTRRVSIAFRNALGNGKAIKVHFCKSGERPQWEEFQLLPGAEKSVPELVDQPPKQLSYRYKFEIIDLPAGTN